MIVLDTCALIFDALSPDKLGKTAMKTIISSDKARSLACSDISLWEIGMLVEKRRIDPGVSAQEFLDLILQARSIQVLSITSEIASLACKDFINKHGDPADRIIAATALFHRAKLVTCDNKLRSLKELNVIWD